MWCTCCVLEHKSSASVIELNLELNGWPCILCHHTKALAGQQLLTSRMPLSCLSEKSPATYSGCTPEPGL